MRVAGELADGVLLSVLSSPTYVSWVSELVAASGRAEPPPITAFVLAAVGDDDQVARDAVRDAVGFFLAAESHTALVGQSQHGEEIRKRVAALSPGESLVVEDEWVDEFAVAGRPAKVRDQLQALLDAGANSLGLWLFPTDQLPRQLERIAQEVLAD